VNNAGASEIDLTIPETNVYWTGTASGDWSTAAIGSPFNWKYGGSGTEYLEGDVVVFDDAATATAVNLATSVAPSSVTFNNTTKNYSISGSVSPGISGTNTTLTKNGNGTVTINTPNGYGGNTHLNAGTVQTGSDNAIRQYLLRDVHVVSIPSSG
jgi:autotransporter-associated beta strand protein